MKQTAEQLARCLNNDLVARLESENLAANVEISGKGVHWHCIASNGVSVCRTACHDLKTPEYTTRFTRNNTNVCFARTSDLSGIVDAMVNWLNGDTLTNLYAKHSFSRDLIESFCCGSIERFNTGENHP